MSDLRIGLVLGGGGVVGGAFHAGVLAALEEFAGWDARRAALVVGTSAGSLTAAFLRAGFPPHDLAARARGAALSSDGTRVLEGMGLVVLHSGHASKIFRRLTGTNCSLRWREAAERERLWIVSPGHAIVEGLGGEYFELPETEMYGEFFDIPQPDELVFVSWFEGGEVFRSGCTFRRGKGRIFYFRPGHETYGLFYDANIQKVITNAVRWMAPAGRSVVDVSNPAEIGWFEKK